MLGRQGTGESSAHGYFPAARPSIALQTAIGTSLEATGRGVVDAAGSERVACLASI